MTHAGKRVGLEVSLAISEAVKLADVDVIAAYPITPQTHIVEHLSEIVAEGELDAAYVPVESEHSAMSCCIGSAAAGARTFTATASQGLALMHEMLFIASGLRLPIVMACVNRSLSAPLSIWGDHTDIMAERDAGWIQVFAENGQECLDLCLTLFPIAERKDVMLPAILNLDGFTLSHVVEPIEIPDAAAVREFVGVYKPPLRLDPAKPVCVGPIGIPEIYTEATKARDEALVASKAAIVAVWKRFEKKFGRRYRPVESYLAEDAETIFVCQGGMAGPVRLAVDTMRAAGRKVGVVRPRLWRPFPFDEFAKAVKGAKLLVVFDRAISTGGAGGPLAIEVKAALANRDHSPKIAGFIGGLAGRDVRVSDFVALADRAEGYAAKGKIPVYEMIGVRE
jgi:pyruvate ferredoxin oxidoreductase alpha subunit